MCDACLWQLFHEAMKLLTQSLSQPSAAAPLEFSLSNETRAILLPHPSNLYKILANFGALSEWYN